MEGAEGKIREGDEKKEDKKRSRCDCLCAMGT